MVVLLLHDRFVFAAQVEREPTQTSRKSPRCRMACLCVLPLAVVTTGAVLVGMGLWSASSSARTVLATAGITVYIAGVVYFVLINLVDRSCVQEEESDLGEEMNEFSANESGQTYASDHELWMLETVV